MARRNRVPRIKAHRKKRNKNPKLSPFQREQRRDKLANQPPIMRSGGRERDCSISQRSLSEYLANRYQRQQEKRKKLLEAKEAVGLAGEATPSVDATLPNDASAPKETNGVHESGDASKRELTGRGLERQSRKKLKDASGVVVSCAVKPVLLNEQIATSLAPPVLAFRTLDGLDMKHDTNNSVESIIARKKEKKHVKKAEARRERVHMKLLEMEKQLVEEVLPTTGSKKRKRAEPLSSKEVAFERVLKKMQSEGTKGSVVEVKRTAGKKAKRAAEDLDQGSVGGDRKRISFADGLSGDEGTDGQHKPMRYPNDKGEKRPSEFYELVDVVRYGERVEAPPVFDTVPSRDAAISRLASKLGHVSERGAKEVTRGKPSERLQLLSSVGGVGERKRLERLGLLAADSSTVAITKQQMLSKKEEMERLRMSVVEAYRRNKRASFDAKKDIDMHHKFPRFS